MLAPLAATLVHAQLSEGRTVCRLFSLATSVSSRTAGTDVCKSTSYAYNTRQGIILTWLGRGESLSTPSTARCGGALMLESELSADFCVVAVVMTYLSHEWMCVAEISNTEGPDVLWARERLKSLVDS